MQKNQKNISEVERKNTEENNTDSEVNSRPQQSQLSSISNSFSTILLELCTYLPFRNRMSHVMTRYWKQFLSILNIPR